MKALLTTLVVLFATGLASANVTVTGNGKVTYTPDLLHVSVGVSSEGKTATDAWQKNEEIIKKVMEALKQFGIDPKDIKTSALNITPRYVHHEGREPELVGYTATYDLNVTVRKMADAGRILDSLVEHGANRHMNIAFGSSQIDKLIDEARIKAATNAHKKAELYVTASGAQLGQVLTINEGQGYAPQYLPFERGLKSDAGTPIAPGEQELSVSVTVVYGINHGPNPFDLPSRDQ
jgi:uncharacterized protein YggE